MVTSSTWSSGYKLAELRSFVAQCNPLTYNRRAMKRFVVALLMCIVPLQFAWAAAGAYCAHEQSANAFHFGHHAHTHQSQSDDGKGKSPLKLHADCASCHTSSYGALLEVESFAVGTQLIELQVQQTHLPPSALPVEPERPKWRLAA